MDISNLFFSVLMRFLHVGSVVALIGAAIYGRFVLTPVLNSLPETERLKAASEAQARFRNVVYVLLVLVVGAGLYNFLTFAGPKHSSQWQMWFGIKMLAVLHILATSVLWAVSPYGDVVAAGKGKRRLASLVVSGLIAVLISNYLRYLTLHGM
jgi:hypothetical protein